MITQFKKVQVIMLPTDKYANIVHSTNKYGGLFNSENYSSMKDMGDSYQNLYFISDENPAIGDFAYNSVFGVGKIEEKHNEECFISIKRHKEDGTVTTPWKRNISNDCKKIIATTDVFIGYTDYDVSPVPNFCTYPAPSDKFISEYINAFNSENIITEALVEYEEDEENQNPLIRICDSKSFTQEINWIPKVDVDNSINIKLIKESWNRDEVVEQMWLAFKESQTFVVNDTEFLRREFNRWVSNKL